MTVNEDELYYSSTRLFGNLSGQKGNIEMAEARLLKNSALLQKMAPDFTLLDANSEPVTLSQVLDEGHRALVVFLRHLG